MKKYIISCKIYKELDYFHYWDYCLRKCHIFSYFTRRLLPMFDVGSGFFTAKIKRRADYEFVLTGRPWLIMDHFLAIIPWKEDSEPQHEVFDRISAWLRISRLSLDYYHKGILYVLGSQIGRVIKVDVTTLKTSKGKFARLYGELDLRKPLLPNLVCEWKREEDQVWRCSYYLFFLR